MRLFAYGAALAASATLAAASLEAGSGAHQPAPHAHGAHQPGPHAHMVRRKTPAAEEDLSKRKDSGSSGAKKVAEKQGGSRTAQGAGRGLKLQNKAGLAWPNSNGMPIDNFMVGNVDWYYTWKATPGWDNAPEDKLFCPMLWGDSGPGANLEDWKKNVLQKPDAKYNKYKCMMGPNEVNQKGQSNMDPKHACQLMRQNMMPLANKGWYFIGPSTTSAPDGTKWYKEFMQDCKDVFNRLDAVSLHYYDTSVEKFKKYVQDWHKHTGKKIWITEFACQSFSGGKQCSKGETWMFMKQMGDWFEQQDYVVGYSPFGAMQNMQGVSEMNRLSIGSNPTPLFRLFAGML